MYIQPDVIYSHILIDKYNDIPPCIHLGHDNFDIVKQSYVEGYSTEEIYTWHSDEKMKRIETQRDALLEALKMAWPIIEAEKYKQDCSYGTNFVQTKADRARSVYDKARAAIEAVEGEKK